MGRRIAEGVGNVYVLNDKHEMVPFAEGEDVPKWAADQMGPHCLTGGGKDDAPPATPPATPPGNPPAEPPATSTGYADLTNKQLKAVIDGRNEGREDDAKIAKGSNKDALVSALEADDAASA